MFGINKTSAVNKKEIVFSTVAILDTKDEYFVFIKNIDYRNLSKKKLTISVEYIGHTISLMFDKEVGKEIFNMDALSNLVGISATFDGGRDSTGNMFQSISYYAEKGVAYISYFSEDKRTVNNIELSMEALGNAGFFDFNPVEDVFREKIEEIRDNFLI